MISKELYNFAIEADKKAENNGGCSTCFCWLFLNSLEDSTLKHFLDWKAKTNISSTSCSNILFYLEDLGIIKILQGVANRESGVDCFKLEIKVLHPFKYNKI